MKTISYSYPRQLKNVMTRSRSPTGTGYPNTVEKTGVEQFNWMSKDIYRVDPNGYMLCGQYRFEMGRLHAPTYIVATLSKRSIETTPKTYNHDVFGTGIGYRVPAIRWLYESEKNRAQLINNCIKGAREQLVNLAQFVAELDKTADLFADKAKRIASAASHMRSGRFSKAARTLKVRKPKGANRNKSFANNWLELSYGWAPIVEDMDGMLRHIARGSRDLLVTSRSTVVNRVPQQLTTQYEEIRNAVASDRLLVNWDYSGSWDRHEFVQLVFRPNSAFWDQVSRLGFTNPGQIAWESVPLSFVVDWFLNVGDWLADLNRGLTLDFVTGCYTEFHRQAGNVSGSGFWTDLQMNMFTNIKAQCSVSPSAYSAVKMKREPLIAADVGVQLILSVPSSVNQAITAAALAVQRLK